MNLFPAPLWLAIPWILGTSNGGSYSEPTLQVDPLLIAEAAEVWSIIAAEQNPLWPEWDATDTPLLLYLPDRQDVLINHPNPPDGFVSYSGPIRFPVGRIMVRDGATVIPWDGQNTAREVNGAPTLVVADTLSNRKQHLGGLLADPRGAEEKLRELDYRDLMADPYEQMGLIAHEAFHVFQDRFAQDKGANELALCSYPVLSVANNVGFALEGDALADCLRAPDADSLRRSALRWLAVRRDRRRALPAEAVAYEDGIEFTEGLATYIEYRMLEVLENRQPGPGLTWAQGFAGYRDLSDQRQRKVRRLVQHMRGEVNVNNDPYGSSPLRQRLYYSGMAIALLLDRLSPGWHPRVLQPATTLTQLAEDALRASPADLVDGLDEARRGGDYESLVQRKRQLEVEGQSRINAMLADIQAGPNTCLTIDYSGLPQPALAMSFTPFGIVAVDERRTIYTLVPLCAQFGSEYSFSQTEARPVLHDRQRAQFQLQLARTISSAEVAEALGRKEVPVEPTAPFHVSLPGVTLRAARAKVECQSGRITVTLLPSPTTP